MSFEIGTATGFEDLVTKIRDFLDLHPNWSILRERRDNLEQLTTNLNEQPSDTYRKAIHSCRYDPRTLNTDRPYGFTGNVSCTGLLGGTSYVRFKLRTTSEIATVRIKGATDANVASNIGNFTLQYSDDGLAWTTVLTVSSDPVYEQSETKDFAVGGTPGTHRWWQIIIDTKVGGLTIGDVWWNEMLLLDGSGDVANHFGSELLFKSTGLDGTDNIYTGIRAEYNATHGWFNLFVNGYTGHDPNEPSFWRQPGAIPGYGEIGEKMVPMVPLWNSSMPYWFSANGRCFRFAIKVSTSYEGGYLGFFLPHATPAQYPYPIAVGGSMVPVDATRDDEWRYSKVHARHSVYPVPACNSSPSGDPDSALYIRSVGGTWDFVGARHSTSDPGAVVPLNFASHVFTNNKRGTWPAVWWDSTARLPFGECLGGGYVMLPIGIVQRENITAAIGALDGIKQISGQNNASENTASFGGNTWVVFGNAARTEINDYYALELET